VDGIWAGRSEGVGLIVCAIIIIKIISFQDFHRVYVPDPPKLDGQTAGRPDDNAIAIPRFAFAP